LKVGLKLEITFLTQHLALSISYPHLGSTTQHHLECRSVDFELEKYKTNNNLLSNC